jgi:hypothetical protein
MADEKQLPVTWAARAGVRTVDLIYYAALAWLAVQYVLPAIRAGWK